MGIRRHYAGKQSECSNNLQIYIYLAPFLLPSSYKSDAPQFCSLTVFSILYSLLLSSLERNLTDYMDFCQMDSITSLRNKTIFLAGQFNNLFYQLLLFHIFLVCSAELRRVQRVLFIYFQGAGVSPQSLPQVQNNLIQN